MKKRVKLTFPQHLIKEPVIFTMAKKYDVMPNIRRARVTETVGEMVLEIVTGGGILLFVYGLGKGSKNGTMVIGLFMMFAGAYSLGYLAV